ncbi:carboxylating nicotinate-nucleotide diphosphorylase [Candidatus Peregrinibacteria bacterium]|nr:carboxylating nicotinate-nucleotide diphosphorylase [Candidatus Peregrinibacteria bacterium]
MLLDASRSLNPDSVFYKKELILYVWQVYLNDLGKGDVTTNIFVPRKRQIVEAEIIAKEGGLLTGIAEAEWFLKKLGIRITHHKKDGMKVLKGDVIMKLKGRADAILSAERTLLNLLQRMSGVATATSRLASKLPRSIKLLATRKTLWGDLDKRAVAIGGGGTHRLNLADAILIKENHIALTNNLEKSLKRVFKRAKKVRFIEIELENLKQVLEFTAICKKIRLPKKLVVMLDNFKPSDVRKAVLILREIDVLVEVSGGITEKNIKQYAIKGVSAVSSGAITNKAASLDFSLNLIP